MSVKQKGRCAPAAHNRGLRAIPQERTSTAAGKLDSPHRLIAPENGLTLPSIDGIKDRFEVAYGFEAAVPLAQTLARKGLLSPTHLACASSVPDALSKALADLIGRTSAAGAVDEFGTEISLADRLGENDAREDCLFFIWNNTSSTQYIPLKPVYNQLRHNPDRDRLMASLYEWLYGTACRLFYGFGFSDTESVYKYRKDWYLEAREAGDDVDLEGEVEAADPATVISYIRESEKLRLKRNEIDRALASIRKPQLREAFRKAYEMFRVSSAIELPDMAPDCREIFKEAVYRTDSELVPAIAISHWRDDAIVAWLDEELQGFFESGISPRPQIIRCFRPHDKQRFLQIINVLPKMVQAAHGLSEWVRLGEEMEKCVS